ncbi:cell division protein PerM [Williamsia sp. SKLECPSW1]
MVTSTGAGLSTRLRELRRAQRLSAARTAGSTRELVVVAFGVGASVLIGVAVLVALTLLTADGGMTGFTAAIGAVWLAAHQVPVSVSEMTIGVLPLLPTIGIVAAVARVTARAAARRSRSDTTAVVLAAVAGPLVITVIALALVMDGSTVVTVGVPNIAVALAATVAVHGVGAGIGVLWARRLDPAAPRLREAIGAAPWAPAALRGAAVGLVALLTAGAALLAGRMLWRWDVVGDIVATGHGFVGGIGLTLLSILYLPNIVIGGAALLVGAAVHVGPVGGDLFGATSGSVPPLPILAAVPTAAPTFAPVLLLLTAVAALVTAVRSPYLGLLHAVRLSAATGGLMAVAMVVLSWIGGGALGQLGTAGATIPAAGLFTFGWWFVVGVLVALVRAAMPSTRRALPVTDVGEQTDGWDDAPVRDDEEAALPEMPADSPQIPADDSPTVDIEPDDVPQRAPAALVFGHDDDTDGERDPDDDPYRR